MRKLARAAPAMAYSLTQIPTQQTRRPGRGARNRAFSVLLEFFANAVGADTALLLKGDEAGKPRVLASLGRDGLEPAVPWVSGSFLGRALQAEGRTAVDRRDPAAAAVAAPVRSHDLVLGALYAGFTESPRLADEELVWIADSYARMAALCIQSPDGLAAVLGSSNWDELTGCLDYRSVNAVLATEVQRSQRQGHALSCCFLDLDGFKRVNDSRGHLEGNRVLAAVGPALIESGRRYDVVGRFGGDEFLVVLPETGGRAAKRVADRLRAQAEGAIAEATGAELGVSIGVAEWASGYSANDLLEAADAALLEAKDQGGGRVIVKAAPQGRFDGLVAMAKEVVQGKASADEDASSGATLSAKRFTRSGD